MSTAISQNSSASNLTPDNWRFYGAPAYESEYSVLDSNRFGMPTYRVDVKNNLDLMKYEDSFVIARIDASRIDLVQKAERYGFRLCDTLVYFQGKTRNFKEFQPLPPGYWNRPFQVGDALRVREIAEMSFTDYPSHYHNDKKLEKALIAKGYGQWASEWKGEGIVIEHERCEFPHVHRKVIAFGLYSEPCELTLAAVDKEHEGKGLYSEIVNRCMNWGFLRGVFDIEISTQIENKAVQKAWARFGLAPHKYVYTFHRWP